jgi:hypothetical protein
MDEAVSSRVAKIVSDDPKVLRVTTDAEHKDVTRDSSLERYADHRALVHFTNETLTVRMQSVVYRIVVLDET